MVKKSSDDISPIITFQDGRRVVLFKEFVEASSEHREAMSIILLAVATELKIIDKSTKTQDLLH